MNRPINLRTLQELLEENGYSEWYALLPTKVSSTRDLKCTFVNFKERRKAAIEIPEAWFQDPYRYESIAALASFAIDDCSVPALELTRQFFFSGSNCRECSPTDFAAKTSLRPSRQLAAIRTRHKDLLPTKWRAYIATADEQSNPSDSGRIKDLD